MCGCVDVHRLIVLGLVFYELVLFAPSRASFRLSITLSSKPQVLVLARQLLFVVRQTPVLAISVLSLSLRGFSNLSAVSSFFRTA